MNTAQDTLSPKLVATEAFTDATAAVGRLHDIYGRNTGFLRHHLEAYVRGEPLNSRVRATYPFVRIITTTHSRLDSRLSYGFVSGPGAHQTTVTRPDLFRAYLTEQIGLRIQNHRVAVEIGEYPAAPTRQSESNAYGIGSRSKCRDIAVFPSSSLVSVSEANHGSRVLVPCL